MAERILVLAGVMGTMIQTACLNEASFLSERFCHHPCDLRGNNGLLNLTQPALIERIRDVYLEAGADLIECNAFNSTSISQTDYQCTYLVHELNVVWRAHCTPCR